MPTPLDAIEPGSLDDLERFTIRWTKPDGTVQYPINPTPHSRDIAIAWAKHGEVGGWIGEVITWNDYLNRNSEVK